jgi:hypothetical protein
MVVLVGQIMNWRERWSVWVSRVGVSLFLLAALAVGIALSAVFFALLFGAALVLGGWLWWQSWRMRRRIDKASRPRSARGDFIDADYVVEEDYRLLEDRRPEEQVAVEQTAATKP